MSYHLLIILFNPQFVVTDAAKLRHFSLLVVTQKSVVDAYFAEHACEMLLVLRTTTTCEGSKGKQFFQCCYLKIALVHAVRRKFSSLEMMMFDLAQDQKSKLFGISFNIMAALARHDLPIGRK